MGRKPQRHTLHEEAEETRRTILRTAHRLFMESGYRAVSTRQIADACGLTQPALYHHFADKKALYAAVMQETLAETGAALERIARRNESVHERLRQVVRYLLRQVEYDQSMMFHDIRHEMEPIVQQQLSSAFEARMIGPIASIFEDGVQQGMLRDQVHGGVNAVTSAFLLLHMLTLLVQRGSYQQGQMVASARTAGLEDVDTIVHVLLYGLAYPDREETASKMTEGGDEVGES